MVLVNSSSDTDPTKIKIIITKKLRKEPYMVLVILLQILTHKLKIYQTPPEDKIKEEKNDDPKYLLEQLEEIQNDYEETERRKWKLNKKLRITLMF
nr:hypothetical protein [Mycoplasmopsis bovis]